MRLKTYRTNHAHFYLNKIFINHSYLNKFSSKKKTFLGISCRVEYIEQKKKSNEFNSVPMMGLCTVICT